MTRFTEDVPEMDRWAQSIGGLILNFGCLEFQTLRWIQILGSEEEAIRARQARFSRRIDSSLALLRKLGLSSEVKSKAQALWAEVKVLSVLRNQLAHNPLAQGRIPQTNETVFSIVDLKAMTPNGLNELPTLSYIQIAKSALRARDINRELSRMIENFEHSITLKTTNAISRPNP
jgi:hypothetical protein